MKKRLLKFALVGGMITTLSYFPYPSSAQLFASVQAKNKGEKTEASPDKMKLREAILALKSQYNVDILFEEKVLSGISISAENVRSNKGIERLVNGFCMLKFCVIFHSVKFDVLQFVRFVRLRVLLKSRVNHRLSRH